MKGKRGRPRKYPLEEPSVSGPSPEVSIQEPDYGHVPEEKTVDYARLGERTITKMVETNVVVGKTDMGKNIITTKMVPKTETLIQPILTFEEAKLLGTVEWFPYPPKEGYWATTVSFGDKKRRFLISDETHWKVIGDDA